MNWTAAEAQAVTAPEEVRVVTRRPDGSLRRPQIIWIVRHGDRVFIRSTNGRDAVWFRAAIGTYRHKYGHYAAIVDHLEAPGPRAATLEVLPA